MHFPYMKIAIYVLTFLTYAYSGYGSSTLVHLRDAIIAAEAIFGDVFKNLVTVVRKFRTVHEVFDAAVDENCIFECTGPDGKPTGRQMKRCGWCEKETDVHPVQNKLYTPTADGCGSLGLRINTEYLPAVEMENCCNEHDICYDTCNSNKELCDLDFKRCLYKYCDTIDKSIGTEYLMTGCKAAAKVLFTGTLTLGCKSYLDSQKRTCYCAPPKQSKEEGRGYSGYKNGNGDKYYKQGKKQKYGRKDADDM